MFAEGLLLRFKLENQVSLNLWLTRAFLWGVGNHFWWFLAFLMTLLKQWTNWILTFFQFFCQKVCQMARHRKEYKNLGQFYSSEIKSFYNDSQIMIFEGKNNKNNIETLLLRVNLTTERGSADISWLFITNGGSLWC